MFSRRFKYVLPLLAFCTLAFAPLSAASAADLAGVDNTLVLTSPMLQQVEPVTIYGASAAQVNTLDPQLGQDNLSILSIENLFLGLTDLDPKTTAVRPEMATKWEANATKDVWTYTLRSDVPWVRYNPDTKEIKEVRKVTAQDFVYGIQRACDPRTGGYYSAVAASMIKGCDVVFRTNPQEINDAVFQQIGVKALSDTQLEISTLVPSDIWMSASSLWVFRAVPKETIDEFGDKWIDLGNIVTNGPYVISQWDRTVNREYLKNPLYPADVNDNYGGNVERLTSIVVSDGSTIYSLYQNNEVDTSGVPAAELQRIRQDSELSKELHQTSDLGVYYFGFMYDKPPFDNVHVRRAFSAVLDRQTFVSELLQGQGVPMAHFMPPGIRGAVPINEVGVGQPNTPGYDPEYAKKELAAGGYPNCENFPDITIDTYTGASSWAVYLQNAVKTQLGCDPNKITVEEIEFGVLMKSIKPDVPTPQRPNMFTLGWGPDYPDAQNWIHDVLSCNAENAFKRPCDTAIDGQIDAAAKESDPQKREQMYRDLEEAFFGPEGQFPIAPLFLNVTVYLVKPWYTGFFETDGLFGGAHWNTRRIDQAAQLAARGKK